MGGYPLPMREDGITRFEADYRKRAAQGAGDARAAPSGGGGFAATAFGLEGGSTESGNQDGAALFVSDPVIADAGPFDWLVPWWDADFAGNALLGFELRVGFGSLWSRWFSFGTWGARCASGDIPPFGLGRGESDPGAPDGRVDTDTLVLSAPADRFMYRISVGALEGPLGEAAVCLRRFGAVARRKGTPRKGAARRGSTPEALRECAIPVPSRSQMTERAAIRGRICSPTCCAMALEAFGRRLSTPLVAAACHDSGAGIYGNWPFNVAALNRSGVPARLDFFSAMEDALPDLEAGRILIASVGFRDGALPGAPIASTAGHLVLVRGLAVRPDGSFGVLVNDPAAPSPGESAREYPLEAFEAAWKGVAYVVG